MSRVYDWVYTHVMDAQFPLEMRRIITLYGPIRRYGAPIRRPEGGPLSAHCADAPLAVCIRVSKLPMLTRVAE